MMHPPEAPAALPRATEGLLTELGGAASRPAKPDLRQPLAADAALLNATEMSRLKWRTRRGLLENDLFIERFFAKFEDQLTVRHANSLNALMNLPDNDLLDLLLGRKTLAQVQPDIDTEDLHKILNMLKLKA